jgi:hypothetical protein
MLRRSVVRHAIAVGMSASALLSAVPTAAQSPTPGATLDGAVALVELVDSLPEPIRQSCVPSSVGLVGEVASAECPMDEGTAMYTRFDSPSTLQSGYDFFAVLTEIEPDSGTDCGEGPFEGEVTGADGSPSGRLLCALAPEGPTVIWTEPGHDVLGVIRLPEGADHRHAASAAAAPTPSPGPISQWASAAVASTQYGAQSWGAIQATGPPDTPTYGDHRTAWTAAGEDIGEQWIELSYDIAVVPMEVTIVETWGNGFVTRIEAWDEAIGAWQTLWRGIDDSPLEVHGFSPTLLSTDAATNRLRITVDTDEPLWNQIDAVELVGIAPSS